MPHSIQVYTGKIGNEGSVRIELTDSNRYAKSNELIEICYTKTHYVIMAGINDTIEFDVGGTPYSAKLEEGNYSLGDLATEITTEMNAAYTPDNNFTCTAPTSLLEKYIISHTSTAFTITAENKTIGFEPTSVASTSHTAQNIYNLNYVNTIHVLSSNFVNGSRSRTNNRFAPILCNIVGGNFGDILEKRYHEYPYKLDTQGNGDYVELKLAFADDKLSPVPNNGGEICIVIKSYY